MQLLPEFGIGRTTFCRWILLIVLASIFITLLVGTSDFQLIIANLILIACLAIITFLRLINLGLERFGDGMLLGIVLIGLVGPCYVINATGVELEPETLTLLFALALGAVYTVGTLLATAPGGYFKSRVYDKRGLAFLPAVVVYGIFSVLGSTAAFNSMAICGKSAKQHLPMINNQQLGEKHEK